MSKRTGAQYYFDFFQRDITVLKQIPRVEQKRTYQKLYNVARKRLSRLKPYSTDVYKKYERLLKSYTKYDEKDVPKALHDVMTFLSLKTSTVRGYKDVRKKRIETLQSRGYAVTEENYEKFIEQITDSDSDGSPPDMLLQWMRRIDV